MQLLHMRLPALVFAFTLIFGVLPAFAASAENAAGADAEAAEEWQPPTRLAPMRAPQTPPATLERSILEALVKVEEEARRAAEAEERALSEQLAREERAQSLKEQQEARESARILRERRQARAKTLSDAIKISMPPPVAVVPNKKDWPLPKMIEDPAWNTPEIELIYRGYYGEADIKALYRLILKEAAGGNPRAMMVLAYAYNRWGSGISSSFSVLHPPMHNGNYWRRWALQLTSPDWVEMRFGDLSLDTEEKLSHYKNAAVYRNGDAFFKLAGLEDKPELLIEAALAGHAEAASTVAFNLGLGTDGFPASPRLASFYWWRGALAGDVRSMLICSEYFYHGQGGFPKDERRAYLFALLAFDTAQKQGGYQSGSPLGGLVPTVERHLAGLVAAMRLDENEIWRLSQELAIFRAAPEEEKLLLLDAVAAKREAILADLENELFAVRGVLETSTADITEQQIIARLEQARAAGDMEQARRARMMQDNQRDRDNWFFIWLGVGGALLVLGSYLAMRLRLYAAIVRLVSATGGEKP